MKNSKIFTAALLVFVSCTSSSCSYASKDELKQMRADMGADIRQNREVADQAMATAKESLEMSQNTEKVSRNTEEIVNRSFKRSMLK